MAHLDPCNEPEVPPSRAALVDNLLFIPEGGEEQVLDALQDMEGKRPVVHTDDFDDGAVLIGQLPPDAIVVLSRLGIAHLRSEPSQAGRLQTWAASAQLPELSGIHSLTEHPVVDESASGQAGVTGTSDARASDQGEGQHSFQDTDQGTWGLHATQVLRSPFTGREVRVAALVDGLDTAHPDWAGRAVVMRSFVPQEPPTSAGPWGTHYLGTALGPAVPKQGPRYGCAPDAIPHVAKVLSASGSGSQVLFFAALEWALFHHCRIALVPLGWGGPVPDATFERVAARAQARGMLLIAGAGNNAQRPQNLGYVVNPAACSSVVAVGSIDPRPGLPPWTPAGAASPSATIDLVAPGVDLRSSVAASQYYARFSGSSTAAAYVAGIAALWAQALPEASSSELLQTLTSHAQPLSLPAADVGAGLVQAPIA